MSVIEAIAVFAVATWVWTMLTPGLTYLAREATIFSVPRLLLVAQIPWLAKLLGCGQCTSLWTGMASYGVLLSLVDALVPVSLSAWWWMGAPVAGICGMGWFDRLARASLAGPVDRLVKALGQPEATKPEDMP